MFRRSSLPQPIAGHVKPLGALVTTPLEDGTWLAVTVADFAVLGEDGVVARTPWTEIESASWDGESRELRMLRVDGAPDVVLRLKNDDVYDATTAVRDQVNSSIVHVEFLRTSAGGDVRALVRRGGDGRLFSQLIARGPVSPDDADALAALERRARAAAGLATT